MFYADNLHAVALPANRVNGQHNRVKTMEIMTIRHSGVNSALALLAAAVLAWAAPARAAETEQPTAGDDTEARLIVEKADQVRFPVEGFQVDVSITSIGSGQTTDVRKYRVLSKGNTNSVVMVTEPASERGQIMLMKGRDLWVFMPDVSQPIRLALSQRLTGQVANGDLARANFAADYHPKLLRSEKIGSDDFHVLELTGVDRSVTYQRVLYWVREKDYWPYKAEFYSLSNRLLKTCKYENFKTMEGRKRPTRLVMEDALRGGEQSVLEYAGMKLRDLPDKIFTKDYLKKLD
jgi:outer membrane lipoprotein-sorting protein